MNLASCVLLGADNEISGLAIARAFLFIVFYVFAHDSRLYINSKLLTYSHFRQNYQPNLQTFTYLLIYLPKV